MGVEVDGKLLAEQSLPLMRKTFIEAENPHGLHRPEPTSLPLMRKTFIEAAGQSTGRLSNMRLFRLCGRLSLRHVTAYTDTAALPKVSSAYAEDFH